MFEDILSAYVVVNMFAMLWLPDEFINDEIWKKSTLWDTFWLAFNVLLLGSAIIAFVVLSRSHLRAAVWRWVWTRGEADHG